MLLFYKNYLKIPFDKYLSLINYFDEVDWKNISFDEQLIYESKLFKIKKTIEQLDYDLNYISEETGFADCSHFIRVFKRKYEVTPKQFRKENK